MERTAPFEAAAPPGQRFGYVVATSINAVVLYAVNAWPGWEALPFLTEDFTQVLGLVNLSLVVSLVVNLVYVFARTPWVRPAGDVLTTAIGVVVIIRMYQVFPFALGDSPLDWTGLMRVALIVGALGTAVALVVQLMALIRALGVSPVGR